MRTLSLAARNLLRNRRRSLATLLALAIGASAVLLFGGYSANIKYSLLSAYVRIGGHLQVQHQDFYRFGNGNPSAYGLAGYQRLLDAIDRDVELKRLVRVATPMLQFGGLAGDFETGVSRTVIGFGYKADDVVRMREWNEFDLRVDLPPYALEHAPDDAVIVGVGVARVLLLCERLHVPNCPRPVARAEPPAGATLPDDIAGLAQSEQAEAPIRPTNMDESPRLELLATQPRGSPNVASVRVVAAEDQGFKELDEVTVILQLAQAQRLVYGRGEPKATSLLIQLETTGSIPEATRRLKDVIAREMPNEPTAVMNFEQLNPFFDETIALFNTIFGFIFVLIGGIVLFTVSNTMMAAVMERTAEIGTIRAVGLRQSGIRRLFVVEGFLLGCVGAVTGVAGAFALAALINALGLSWVPPGSSTPLPLSIRISGEYGMIVGTALGLVVIATLSAWLPAWRAARLSIVDALRHA